MSLVPFLPHLSVKSQQFLHFGRSRSLRDVWCNRCSFLITQGIAVQGDEVNERVSRTDSGDLYHNAALGRNCPGGFSGSIAAWYRNWMERPQPCEQRGAGDADLGEAGQ